MATFKVRVLCPAKPIADVEADSVVIPSGNGYVEVLPGHTSLVGELGVGSMTIKRSNGGNLTYFLSGGYYEAADKMTLIIADVVEAGNDINKNRAIEAEKRAQQRLVTKDPNLDVGRALLALKRAQERLLLAGK
jgi:F-type H+-transporting ATPase subunit epsilon